MMGITTLTTVHARTGRPLSYTIDIINIGLNTHDVWPLGGYYVTTGATTPWSSSLSYIGFVMRRSQRKDGIECCSVNSRFLVLNLSLCGRLEVIFCINNGTCNSSFRWTGYFVSPNLRDHHKIKLQTRLTFSWNQITRKCMYIVTTAWLWPWPCDLDTRPWPRCSEAVPVYQK